MANTHPCAGLKYARREGEASAFLDDPLLKRCSTYTLSTSNVSGPHLATIGFTEVATDGGDTWSTLFLRSLVWGGSV